MKQRDNLTRFDSIKLPQHRFLKSFPYLTNSRSDSKISSLNNLVNLTRTKNTSTYHSRLQSIDLTNAKNLSFGTNPTTNYFSTYSKKVAHNQTTSTLISDKSLKSFYDFKKIHRITDYSSSQLQPSKQIGRINTLVMLKGMKNKIQKLLKISKLKRKDAQMRLIPSNQEQNIDFLTPIEGKKKFVRLIKKIEFSGAHKHACSLNQEALVQLVALEQDLMNQNYNDFYRLQVGRTDKQNFLEYLRMIIKSIENEGLQPNTLDDFESFINDKWWYEEEKTIQPETEIVQDQEQIHETTPVQEIKIEIPNIILIPIQSEQEEVNEQVQQEIILEKRESIKKQQKVTPAPTPKINRTTVQQKKKKSNENILSFDEVKQRSRSSQLASISNQASSRNQTPPKNQEQFSENLIQRSDQISSPDRQPISKLQATPSNQTNLISEFILSENEGQNVELQSPSSHIAQDQIYLIEIQSDSGEKKSDLENQNLRPQRRSYMKDMRKSIISSPNEIIRKPTRSISKTLGSSQVFRRGVTMKHKSGLKPSVDESYFKAKNEEALNAEIFLESLLNCENIYDFDLAPHRVVSLDRFKPEIEQWIGDMDMMLKEQNILNIANN